MFHSNRSVPDADSTDHPPNHVLDQPRPAVIGATAPGAMTEHVQSTSTSSNHAVFSTGSTSEEPTTSTAAVTAAFRSASLQEDRKSIIRIERETFLLFIKILFKVLEDDPPTRTRAERIVVQCRRRSENGDPAFQPLMRVVERHLRILVGEAKWRRVHLLVHHRLLSHEPRAGERSESTRDRPTAILVGKS